MAKTKKSKIRRSIERARNDYAAPEIRSFPAYMAPAIERYAKLTGEISFASNALSIALSWIFDAMLESAPIKTVSIAVWNSIRTDSGQREALLAAAQARLASDSRLLSEISWLLKSAEKISTFRNDAIHTPTGFLPTISWRSGAILPDESAPPARAQRLKRHGPERLFKLVRGDFNVLTAFAYRLYGIAKSYGLRRSWPKRPKLLSPELLAQTSTLNTRQSRRPKGQPRQRASSLD